jgi:hypothetical protein
MRLSAIALMCSALCAPAVAQRPARQPIIDVHRHASWPGTSDAEQRAALLADMDAEGIVLSLLHINEPGDVQGWLQAAPGRFIGGPAMPCPQTQEAPFYRCFAETKGWPDHKAELKRLINSGVAPGAGAAPRASTRHLPRRTTTPCRRKGEVVDASSHAS